jgi:hypothetical protein
MTATVSKRSVRSNVRELVPQSPNALFEIVGDMEGDVAAIEDFAHAIELIICASVTEDQSAADALQRLAWEIKGRAAALEADRGKLFRALHPNKGHFERVGWPGERGDVS